MSYCFEIKESAFFISSSNFGDAMKAVAATALNLPPYQKKHKYVDMAYPEKDNLSDMLDCWGYVLELSGGNVVGITTENSNFGDEKVLFTALAPFVGAGSFIHMMGEDGSNWRWVFDGFTLKEQFATLKWEG